MANISFDLAGFNNFIREAKINLSETDLSGLNTIFSESDTVSEAGEKRADGKLTGDEMREFFSKLTGNLKTLVDKYLISTNEEYAKEAAASGANSKQDRRGIQLKPVMCEKTPAEQKKFQETLENAKNILLANKDKLGLTDGELEYIKSATTESVNMGAARYDNRNDDVRFNLNGQIPSMGNMIKVLLHEVNHAVRKTYNSQSQERECESKAIKRAYILYEQGAIEDAAIYQSRKDGKVFNISDFKNEESVNTFVELWLDESGYRGLPEV